MATSVPAPLVSEIARDVVQQVAPRELPLFPATSRAYFERPEQVTRRDAGDRTLGFGPEFSLFLTPAALVVTTATLELVVEILKDALKKEGTEAAGEYLRRLFRRGRSSDPAPVALTREELAKVREHAIRTAGQLVPQEQAVRIADALTASLATS